MGMIKTVRSVGALQGARVCPSRMVGHPQQMLTLDEDHLVLLNETAPPALRVVDVARARVVRQSGSRGHAPGAFLGPRSLTRRPGDAGGVWAFDSVLQRLTRFEVGEVAFALPARQPAPEVVALDARHPVQQAEWDADTVVSTGAFPSGRLARFDADGRLLEQFGTVPGDPDEDIATRHRGYDSVLRVHPDGGLYVLATRRADRLEILGAEGSVLASAPRLQEFEPHYRVDRTFGRPVALFDERTRTGYLDVVARRDRIVALYSGRRPLECGSAAAAGRLVVELGWDLTLRRAFELDHDAVAIALSPCGRTLFTAVRDPGPGLLRYAPEAERMQARVIPFPAARVV